MSTLLTPSKAERLCSKLCVAKGCEHQLGPSVPMALRGPSFHCFGRVFKSIVQQVATTIRDKLEVAGRRPLQSG